MKESTDLFVPLDVKAVDVYGTGAVEKIVAQIEEKARSIVPDVSGDEGRAAVKAIAYRVSRSKTFLDGLGKDLVADLKRRTGAIDKERRVVRERLDALRDDIRRPLTEWEEREQARVEAIKERMQIFEAEPPEGVSEEDLRKLIAEVEGIVVDSSFEEYEDAARKNRGAYLYSMYARLRALETARDEEMLKNAERACKEISEEADRRCRSNVGSAALDYMAEALLESAQGQASKYGRHSDLVSAATTAAVKKLRAAAEQARKKEQEAAQEAARKAAEEATRKAEAEAKEREEQAARKSEEELAKAVRAQELAQQERIRAEERARIQAEEAAAAERRRIEEEQAKRHQEELARQRDKENRERIRSEVAADLTEVINTAYLEGSGDLAVVVADDLLAGNIRHVKVMF